jgi:membrane-bound lytic murein transglycosylase A
MKAKLALFWGTGLFLLSPSLVWGQGLDYKGITYPPLLASEPQSQLPPLQEVKINPSSLGIDEQLWGITTQGDNDTSCNNTKQVQIGCGDRKALLEAIDHSLEYLATPSAAKAYENYPMANITLDRVRRSLIRFRQLLITSSNAAELQEAVEREFAFYRSRGQDNHGTVLFTGYFEPIYPASPIKTAEYIYPIYGLPPDFAQWKQPHPTRIELEGKDGLLGEASPLSGYEIAWLRDRLQAYLIQVQGSAKLEMTDGSVISVGYAGKTEYPYVSLGAELIKDGHFQNNQLNLPIMINFFKNQPTVRDEYISRNNRFIFFRQTDGSPATGSIGVPVVAERSIATDKSLMPPGALALIRTYLPTHQEAGQWKMSRVSRYVLDQDTGGAIKGPGRVDVFMGSGPVAGDRAGLISEPGYLYYLLLKE